MYTTLLVHELFENATFTFMFDNQNTKSVQEDVGVCERKQGYK